MSDWSLKDLLHQIFSPWCLGLGIVGIMGLHPIPTAAQSVMISDPAGENCGGVCIFPHCWEVDVEYNPQTIQLTSIDLHDPDDPKGPTGRVWATFQGAEVDQGVAQAAMQAMQNGLQPRHMEQPCLEPDCVCHKPAGVPPWGNWQPVNVDIGFSIPRPTEEGRLYYTAHGTVQARGRVKLGPCIKEKIDI